MSTLVDDARKTTNRFNQVKHAMASEMAHAVKAHTDRAFALEGYVASAYSRWQGKKRKDGRKILHGKSGDLRAKTYIASSTFPRIVIQNDVPYADFHNEGGGHVPERHFMDSGPGKSPMLDSHLDAIVAKHMRFVLSG